MDYSNHWLAIRIKQRILSLTLLGQAFKDALVGLSLAMPLDLRDLSQVLMFHFLFSLQQWNSKNRVSKRNHQTHTSSLFLHSPLEIDFREDDFMAAYDPRSSTVAQPPLAALVHVPPHAMHRYLFRRESFVLIARSLVLFPVFTPRLVVNGRQLQVVFCLFLVLGARFRQLFFLQRLQCFLGRINIVTKCCKKRLNDGQTSFHRRGV